MPLPEMVPVSSSRLDAVGYSEEGSVLYARFPNGRLYRYFEIPYGDYLGILRAASAGTFFGQIIKGKRYEEVT
jgi:hypothetical protein